MYLHAGTKSDKPIGKELEIAGHAYIVGKHSYLLPHYHPSSDEFGERINYLQMLTDRFFRHCELFAKITRNDTQIAALAAEYEQIGKKEFKKRMSGAILIGAVVTRCEALCTEIISIQEMIYTLNEEDEAIAGYR